MPRTKGALGSKTIQKQLAVDPDDLNPPPFHARSTPWTEDQAVAELEYLIRFLSCEDPKKLFPTQCIALRGYRSVTLYGALAKQFPETAGELWEFAKAISHDKVACGTLNKTYDSRFGVFASMNLSNWRQNHQIDTNVNIMIKTRDYKGTQETINKRMNDKKKGA